MSDHDFFFFIISRGFFCFKVFLLRNTKIITNYVLFSITVIKYSNWFSVIICLWFFFCFYSAQILKISKCFITLKAIFIPVPESNLCCGHQLIHIHFLVFHNYFIIWKFNSKTICTLSPPLFPLVFNENKAGFFSKLVLLGWYLLFSLFCGSFYYFCQWTPSPSSSQC